MESTLVPDATVPVSVETCPIVVQPPTNSMPELTIKRTMKRKAYVLVPPAPYPLRLPRQGCHNNLRSQANSSTSVPLVIRDELQFTVNKPEQRAPPSQMDGESHSNRRSKANSSTSVSLVTRNEPQPTVNRPEQRLSQVDGKVPPKTLSDIGISVPTTVRRPGSFIIHTFPQVRTRTQSTEHIMEPVNPRTKSPYVGNPVTAQVITKGSTKKSLSSLKFKKSKAKSTPSSSNKTAVVTSTDTQGRPKSPKLPQSQPKLSMSNPEVSNDVTEIAAKVLERVLEKVDSMWVSNYFDFIL